MQQIVIVGGGAGGLQLATQLGRKLGLRKKASVTLIDRATTHLWKPLLHEVATGALDSGVDELNYRAHGSRYGFNFQQGEINDINRSEKTIILQKMIDDEGELVLPERTIGYDTLVLAIGSITNDFNVTGVSEHTEFLDSRTQAELFHRKLLNEFIRASSDDVQPHELNIAIVGAGATGVELSAELYNTADTLTNYGMTSGSANRLKVTLIEAGDRILPALPKRISAAATRELEALGVTVRTNTTIVESTKDAFITDDGERLFATLKVWAAGVKAQECTQKFGLEINRNNQLITNDQLQTSDENIFAIGDCAAITDKNGIKVPPRAQAAHQQSKHLLKVLKARQKNQTLPKFEYKDHGSLVSLSHFSTIGSLMGNLTRGSMMIEGKLARIMYVSLYRMHQKELHGYWHTLLLVLIRRINKVIKPKLKLH